MKIAVVGYGVEGRAAVDYWLDKGDITVCAPKLEATPPAGVEIQVGPDYLAGLTDFDLVVRSPGVRPDLIPAGVATTSVIREFLRVCPAPVIGVTGTQGKGTTCTAIAAVLRAAGHRVFLGGNIGVPPLAFLGDIRPSDWVVLEVSNFQLMDCTSSPGLAVVLPVTPDHLNWHTGLPEYFEAKAAIAAFQHPEDSVVFAADNPVAAAIAATSPGRHIPVGRHDGFHARDNGVYRGNTRIVDAADVQLRGRHVLENLAAAVAAVYDIVDGDAAVVNAGIGSMKPLPHRLAPVKKVGGVLYVNDSLSTTPETSRAAMAAYPEPKIVILGGSSKGMSYQTLAEAVEANHVRKVLLVGQDAPAIASALDARGFTDYEFVSGPMSTVVEQAAASARPGDVVLLSPACASFDSYRDYADRGDQFAAAVQTL
ncbi:UDP-N-acetylmuramoyl-L-alanine--D-glutamate ligase [Catellatospora chokoriensis]|uniref:UDP-N-acetylmuramoylalanine--D-glutamate ligase n=1 Tax=Catellatospora chokoriensis TaxID=310353 RepID=A0A8J3K1D3_9ACTN|nr:UDP-N-acetylmuramoyl-L-alanine--D-glutamate ligase [Catellatospora chokoriensis]GIF87649.1 UDP-N-acetylmuramoylalanine--D-glutamate ligase [Catellatospora chokoriensis]